MKHGRRAAVVAAVILATPMLAARLGAQGIGVNTHSACNSGRNEAVTGDPCADGSAVFYNPAALAFEPSVVAVGGSIIRNSHTFQFNADPSITYKRGPANPLVPHAWLNWRGGERWALGAGFWAPYGLTLKWPITGANPFPGRFTGYDNTVKAIYVQPTVAYQLVPKRLSVAAGLDIVMATVDISMREDLALQSVPGTPFTFNNFGIPYGTDFANARLKGNATAFAGHFAALYRISDALSIGGRYMMGATAKFDKGTATFTPVPTGRTLAAGNPFGVPAGTPLDALFAPQFAAGGALESRAVKTEITYPAMAVLGVSVKPVKGVELSGDWQWTNWAKWDTLALHFGGADTMTQQLYLLNQNTNTFRLGAQYAATPSLDLRAGWGYNKAAETAMAVSPLLPEADRDYLSAGLSYHLTNAFTADLFVQHIIQADRQGRVYPLTLGQVKSDNPDLVNVGLYTAKGDVFGATLRYTFGPVR